MEDSLRRGFQSTTLATALIPSPTLKAENSNYEELQALLAHDGSSLAAPVRITSSTDSTVNGVLIGLLSSFGSAILIALIFLVVYFFRYTSSGRILLDRLGRPGEYDDEQAYAREEAEALEGMDDLQRTEYFRAKAFIQANPPDSLPTDISLSQYLAIQEKGVSAWEFEPELEIANCFVEGRTEIEFFDSECSVLSNLPLPKQNEVYYWESKIYDKPESTLLSIGVATKPYPLFRLPGMTCFRDLLPVEANMRIGWHKYSVAYASHGQRRYNQPFHGPQYGPAYVQGDVIGVGYRPRTGTVFFTRNGKKLEDVAHGLKSQNLFPAVGANGPCTVHVNFGQSGFVFIEANVKKWGLAPMTGSLAPPPPYGSEQGSILLEAGRERTQNSQGQYQDSRHGRTRSGNIRYGPPTSPGPVRSPTDISLTQFEHISPTEEPGESSSARRGLGSQDFPPEYTSPHTSDDGSELNNPDARRTPSARRKSTPPPIPSYSDAIADARGRDRSASQGQSNSRAGRS
ncbi:concanavalin A-like lectin/glucanase domain-containing protein [Bisporella sp. PMI_857]|nr:concanavalin A-like lectin/glucanase domain-containing protein [Bisporella sp. PMI_857]